MARRVLAAACAALAVGCTPTGDRASSVRPNILLIVADDLGYTDLGAYGGEIRTPNIDALAREGVAFTQFHTAPQCAPTRAMLMSGNNNHVAGADPDSNNARLSDRVVPFPRILSEAGYRTLMVGKWHLGSEPDAGPVAAGFERSFALAHGAANHFNAVGMDRGGSLYTEDGEVVDYAEGSFTTELFTDRLIELIGDGTGATSPFFAMASYTAPHWPLQVPEEDRDLYAGRYDAGYDVLREQRLAGAKRAGVVEADHELPPRDPAVAPWSSVDAEERRIEARKMELLAAMVENLDRHVGRLLDHLRRTGQYENTLVVFMSDNGANAADHYEEGRNRFLLQRYDNSLENMGSATSWVSIGPEWAEASTAPFSRYKQYTRQGGVVSPMIVTGPGVEGEGMLTSAFTTVMDLAPTFLDVAGASYPIAEGIAPMLGESLVGLLRADSPRVHADGYTVALLHNGRAFFRQGRWKLVTSDAPFAEEKFELYDLETDPGETTDLREAMPGRYEEMLHHWRTTTRAVGVVVPGGF